MMKVSKAAGYGREPLIRGSLMDAILWSPNEPEPPADVADANPFICVKGLSGSAAIAAKGHAVPFRDNPFSFDRLVHLFLFCIKFIVLH
jgi:hypothetical protein